MKKVLIITYYWPPSSGAGVQRWVKLSKYLYHENIIPHILTVDENYASYMQIDKGLEEEVLPEIPVYKTKSFEPINYYAKIVGKENTPTAGFSNVKYKNFWHKIASGIRSNLFIPDPRKGWNKYAFKKALEIIDKEKIQIIITTSPPHSSQLIGLKLKRILGDKITWIADFRDTWTDIYYYKLLNHSFFSHRIDKRYERNVLLEADHLITVGEKFKNTFLEKSSKLKSSKISVIHNGYDPSDFNQIESANKNGCFMVCYTGTMSDHYRPQVFFDALKELINNYPDQMIKFQMVGLISPDIKNYIINSIGSNAVFVPLVPHKEVIKYMLGAFVLLLVTQGKEGTNPGKTFEYLASKKRIVCIGLGDAANIIDECNAGKAFDRSSGKEIYAYLEKCLGEFINNEKHEIDKKKIKLYSRKHQANMIKNILLKEQN